MKLHSSFSTPWVVPPAQPIELFFFQRVFLRLIEKRDQRALSSPIGKTADDTGQTANFSLFPEEEQEVPLVDFKRAMVRLCKVMEDTRTLDFTKYDVNGNGKVGWHEFCSLWKKETFEVHLTLAERVFLTFEDGDRSILGKFMSILVFLTILVSTGSFIISTLPEMRTTCPGSWEIGFHKSCVPKPKPYFNDIDLACVIFFTLEYGIRVVLSAYVRADVLERDKLQLLEMMVGDENVETASRLKRVVIYVLCWTNLIDLAAIMPWYLSTAFESSGDEENVIIRLIRLTRVIRAFRLGRRFEAVIIIMKSIKRSVRALNVLVLNLFLGMIFFGALMYFVEQGTWDPAQQAYVRDIGTSWNDGEKRWVTDKAKSPFDSIPACFWWAIVTATTVGYGDTHTPTTNGGKAVAALSMVWAFTVLALPIGVIGNNFSQVWEDYDKEKEEEKHARLREQEMFKTSIALGDPLHLSRRLIIEVWHDAGLHYQAMGFQNEFLGEVDFMMELNPPGKTTRRTIPLTTNKEKARREARGQLTFEYSWQPLTEPSSDALLRGNLEVTVLSAKNLVSVDWKGTSSSDPFAVVIAHPNSPNSDGTVNAVAHRTHTVKNTVNPHWGETMAYHMCWKNWKKTDEDQLMSDTLKVSVQLTDFSSQTCVSDSHSTAVPDKSFMSSTVDKTEGCEPFSKSEGPEASFDAIYKVVPELQEDLAKLNRVVPQLQGEIRDIQKDMQLILATLRSRAGKGGGGDTAT